MSKIVTLNLVWETTQDVEVPDSFPDFQPEQEIGPEFLQHVTPSNARITSATLSSE